MSCPTPFQFANEFGIIRKEGVFSTINVNNMIKNAENYGCNEVVTKLTICESITRNCQKGVTTTLVDPETNSQVVIPAGATINKVVVVDRTCGNLGCDLSFMLGFLSDCVEDEQRLATMAQRLAPQDKQITGGLINEVGTLVLIEGVRLNADTFQQQLEIYNGEAIDNGNDVADLDTAIIFGQNYVGELQPIMPAITITSGELCRGDIEFFLYWTPPYAGVVCKPLLVCEPCSPKSCYRACNPCSPRNKYGYANYGYGSYGKGNCSKC